MHVAKPNYQYEKRQRELEKKKKKAEKALRKASHGQEPAAGDAPEESAPASPPETESAESGKN